MGYGSKQNEKGESYSPNSGRMPVMTGERVEGCKLVYFGLATKDDAIVSGQASIKFEQPNGAVFNATYLDGKEAWQMDQLNRHILHIASKVMSPDDYYAAIGEPANFDEFITRAGEAVMSKLSEDVLFNLKITLRAGKDKYWPQFPAYGNFMEVNGVEGPSILSTNEKYDIYEAPEMPAVDENMEVTSDEEDVF